MRHPSITILWASLVAPIAAAPGEALADAASVSVEAHAQRLAEDPTWLKLGHYKRALFGHLRGDVITPSFYLAPEGRNHPDAELNATIAAMFAPVGENANAHAQCRFPARFMWLKQHLDLSEAPEVACGAFHDWAGEQRITSLSLVLASGYLGNPSSYFGHVLLRFNSAEDANLFATTLNFGANYPRNENGAFYIFKGMAGGYSANFSEQPFYQFDSRYSEDELRDAWEYRLNLPQADVDFVVAHAWELMSASNRYFFLRQNCAFHMAELVNLVVDEPLIPSSKPWVLPPDVFEETAHAKFRDAPLVRDVVRRVSRQGRLRDHYYALSQENRNDVRLYIADHAAGLRRIQSLPAENASRTLETLIDYYTFVASQPAQADADVRAARNEVMLTRMRMPAGESAPEPPALAPHEGQGSSMLQIGALYNEADHGAVDLRFRAAYYDFLSHTAATLPNSELAAVDLTVRFEGDDIDLRRLDLVRIVTLNASGTDLPYDRKGHSWRFRLGAEQSSLACGDCLVGFAEGGFGKSWRLGDWGAAYGFADARLTTTDRSDTNALAGARLGLLFGGADFWRAHVEAGAMHTLNGEDETRPYASAEIRFGADPRWDFRIRGDYEDAHGEDAAEIKAGVGFYW